MFTATVKQLSNIFELLLIIIPIILGYYFTRFILITTLLLLTKLKRKIFKGEEE